MRAKTTPLLIALALLITSGSSGPGRAAEDASPRLLAHLPKDPLFVALRTNQDLGKTFAEALDLLGSLAPELSRQSVETKLAEFDERVGCSMTSDVLARLGPELALSLDLPPIDSLLGLAGDPPALVRRALADIGMVATTRDTAGLDDCVRKLLTYGGEGTAVAAGGLTRIDFAPGPDAPPAAPRLSLYYGLRNGLFSLGASAEFVTAALDGRPAGARLENGADFAAVRSHLDKAPEGLVYLNLPKLRDRVTGSSAVQTALAANPEAKTVLGLLALPEFTSSGLGSSSVTLDGGTRTTTFAPAGLSGGSAWVGMVVAIAVPNLLGAIDRGKQKRTMADMRFVAIAVEEYSIDNDRYPGPTAGFVPIAQIAPHLTPIYAPVLPEQDGWGHALLYWSDGERYRIVSPGKDGETQRDWSGQFEAGPTATLDSDIVFGDGIFLSWPQTLDTGTPEAP